VYIRVRSWRSVQVRLFGWTVTLFLGLYLPGISWRTGEWEVSLLLLFVHAMYRSRVSPCLRPRRSVR
jgi:hypothetical protein